MGPLAFPSVLVFQFFFFVSMIMEGTNGQVNGWLNAHATFYGANQNPITLGKLQF